MKKFRIDPITKIAEIRKRIPLKEIAANPHESFEMHQKIGMTVPRFSNKPVEVFNKRYATDTYQLIDGHRRVLQAERQGKHSIDAWVTLKRGSRKELRKLIHKARRKRRSRTSA